MNENILFLKKFSSKFPGPLNALHGFLSFATHSQVTFSGLLCTAEDITRYFTLLLFLFLLYFLVIESHVAQAGPELTTLPMLALNSRVSVSNQCWNHRIAPPPVLTLLNIPASFSDSLWEIVSRTFTFQFFTLLY